MTKRTCRLPSNILNRIGIIKDFEPNIFSQRRDLKGLPSTQNAIKDQETDKLLPFNQLSTGSE